MNAITKFTRFQPAKPQSFLDGLELASDLIASTGTILYTAGTELSIERVTRLLRLRESNPALDEGLVFKIKRSAKLVQRFRDEIKGRLLDIFRQKQSTKLFTNIMDWLGDDLDEFIDMLLDSEAITLAIFKVKFICESSKSPRAVQFVDHATNVAIFSAALAKSHNLSHIFGDDRNRLVELMKVALFHNFGALQEIDALLKCEANERFEKYWDLNRRGCYALSNLQFSYDVMDALRFLGEYYAGRKDFVGRQEWAASMANVVLVVDAFLQMEGGLFKEPVPARHAVDQLNVRAMSNEYNNQMVEALTLALNLQDIFDFYHELENLMKQCPPEFDSAYPYPMTGFKSPTLFVCKNNQHKCKFFEGSIKAVNLVKRSGELMPGQYHRCKLLTPKLQEFYSDHYEEIKEEQTVKA